MANGCNFVAKKTAWMTAHSHPKQLDSNESLLFPFVDKDELL